MAQIVTIYSDGTRSKYKATGQRVTVVEQYRKRGGAIGKREVKSFVSHDYCPFCGKKF